MFGQYQNLIRVYRAATVKERMRLEHRCRHHPERSEGPPLTPVNFLWRSFATLRMTREAQRQRSITTKDESIIDRVFWR